MSGVKLETAKRAVAEAITALQSTDRFSVVVYDDQVEVVIASTAATGEARRAAMERLARSTPAAARTWAVAGCAAANRSPAT